MSYAIGQVIFGISPDYELGIKMDDYEVHQFNSIETYYSGSADVTPMMIGSQITTIDEVDDVDLTELWEKCNQNLDEHKKVFEEKKQEFFDEVNEAWGIPKEVIDELTTWVNKAQPTIKIIWSTS